MRKNVAKVIEAFRNRREAIGDSKRTIWTDGHSVFSYKMVIAFYGKWEFQKPCVYVCHYDDAPSATTRTQIRALQVAFPDFKTYRGVPTIPDRNRHKKG